jgi:hypothetical protein
MKSIRFVTASIVVLAVLAGFALGRVTGPHEVADAQMPSLSHFMCYQTQFATARSAAATVVDQFGQNDRKFLRADMICAPARKKPMFKPIQVPGPADHLMCYHTEGASINAVRDVMNQLERSRFKGLTPRYFCLPTFKKG